MLVGGALAGAVAAAAAAAGLMGVNVCLCVMCGVPFLCARQTANGNYYMTQQRVIIMHILLHLITLLFRFACVLVL